MICYLYPEPSYFFYSPDVPAILYYAHIPAAILALLLGLYILWNGKNVLLNRILFSISTLFFFWTVGNLIAWTNIHSDLLLFTWSFFGIILSLIAIFCVYFIYVFLDKKDISLKTKSIFLALLAPVVILAPTNLNLSGFDIAVCDAFQFEWLPYKSYTAFLGLWAMVWILILSVKRYRVATKDFKTQIALLAVGMELLLFMFFGMEFLAAFLTKIGMLPDSGIELYGMFGMVVFIIYLNILIVRFSLFNIKLIATQALVWGLVALIGSQFFFIKESVNFILNGIGFLATIILGQYLVLSVKKEIEQKEEIQKRDTELRKVNEGQKNLLHIVNHQIKGYLSKGRLIFAGLKDDADYGPMPEQAKPLLDEGFKSMTEGVDFVKNFLDAANINKGSYTYKMEPFDFRALVAEAAEKLRGSAEEKGLKFEVNLPEGEHRITGDKEQLSQAVRNLIDNSIRYTPSGSLKVGLEKRGAKLLLKVEDTGVGISEELRPRLFTEGGRGKDSLKININSTGFGLSFVKSVAVAHKGRVWAESEGEGKGSQFYMELPVLK